MNPCRVEYDIPYLPDFLFDHTLLAQSEPDRLAECLTRWTQMLGSLWSDSDGHVGYGLKFLTNPSGGMQITASVASENETSAKPVQRRFEHAFERLRIPLRATDQGDEGCPFTDLENTVVEVRQWEGEVDIATKKHAQESAYVSDGWWGPTGVFSEPLHTLARSNVAVGLFVLLSPTVLSAEEKTAVIEHAVSVRSRSQRQISNLGVSREQLDQKSLSAGISLGRLATRLDAPFLLQCFVVSPSEEAALAVAQSLRSTINSKPSLSDFGEDHQDLPASRAMLLQLVNTADRFAAMQAICSNRPDYGIRPHPSRLENMQRLPHLIDAKGAATCFRLPVSVKAGLPGIEVRQLPPDFDPGPDILSIGDSKQSVRIGDLADERPIYLPLSSLSRHVFITGFTGSGKTETTLNLLHQLWNTCDVPFLVIEPAKKEYRGLKTVSDWCTGHGADDSGMSVFTLCDETESPLRLNPMQPVLGVRIEKHMGRLLTCLESVLPQFGALPSILLEAMELAYAEYGWTDLTESAGDSELRSYPTFKDLTSHAVTVIEKRKYSAEVQSNLQGAVRTRLYPLQAGSLGKMLDTHCPTSHSSLFDQPVVLEMNDLRAQERDLLTLLILVLLREYREQQGPVAELRHVAVIEEAHNVFPRTEDKSGLDTSNAKFQAVQELSNMLAEMRAYGQSIIIADQSPHKVAPDALRNTGTQIAHQIRDANDREAMANTMVMSGEQSQFLAKLLPGHAALFTIGLQRTTFVSVPHYKPKSNEDLSPLGQGYSHAFSLRDELPPESSLGESVLESDKISDGLRALTRNRYSGEMQIIPRTALEAVGLEREICEFSMRLDELTELSDEDHNGWIHMRDTLMSLAKNAFLKVIGASDTDDTTRRALTVEIYRGLWATNDRVGTHVPDASSLHDFLQRHDNAEL